MFEVFESSKKAINRKVEKRNKKYPWDILQIGQSFAVDKNTVKKHSLVCMAGQIGLRKNKKFVVIDHGEDTNSYEVARIE